MMQPELPISHQPEQPRNAVVGLVGRTNSGKSTLLNTLVGEPVSIVSPVVQTTRNTIRGILDEQRGQLVLVDTPGLHKAEGHLGKLLNRMARQAAANVDILLLLLDGSKPPELEDEGWMRRLLTAEQPTHFLLNKCDLTTSHEADFRKLWAAIQQERGVERQLSWFTISATTGRGLRPLLSTLFKLAEPGERPFGRDMISDYPRRLVMADIIREQYLPLLRDELPHELGVRIDSFNDDSQEWRVAATLFINRPSQKPIVLGPKGRTLRKVRELAASEISRQFSVSVKLDIWIKVEKNWMENFWLLRQMGYVGGHQG